MNPPSLEYDPYEQYMGKSSIDLAGDLRNCDPLSVEERRRATILQNHQFPHRKGQAASDRPFEFVPAEEVKRLQQRVNAARENNRSHGQHIGFSNISIGDDGGHLKSFSHKPSRVNVRCSFSHEQRHGAESASAEAQNIKPRKYPGDHGLTKANMSNSCVPPVFPHPEVKTKMGEEHMDSRLVPPEFRHPRVATQLGDETSGRVQPTKPGNVEKSKMLNETDTESLISASHLFGVDNVEGAPWFAATMDEPLPNAPPRRTYPNGHGINKTNIGSANGHISSLSEEMKPPVIKSSYPGGHKFGNSNIGPNLGQSEVAHAGARGSYSHGQRFGKSNLSFDSYCSGKDESDDAVDASEGASAASIISLQKRRHNRFGESNISSGGLVTGGPNPRMGRRHFIKRGQETMVALNKENDNNEVS